VVHIPVRKIGQDEFIKIQKTVELYSGDLLDGWYQEWCLVERERYREMYLEMVEKLMGYCEQHEQYEEAIYYGSKILEMDPTQELIHLRLMKLKHLMKDRIAVIHQYFRCRKILQEELGVEPSRELQDFYAQVLLDTTAGKENVKLRESGEDPLRAKGFQQSLKRMAAMMSDQENILMQLMNEVRIMQAELGTLK